MHESDGLMTLNFERLHKEFERQRASLEYGAHAFPQPRVIEDGKRALLMCWGLAGPYILELLPDGTWKACYPLWKTTDDDDEEVWLSSCEVLERIEDK